MAVNNDANVLFIDAGCPLVTQVVSHSSERLGSSLIYDIADQYKATIAIFFSKLLSSLLLHCVIHHR